MTLEELLSVVVKSTTAIYPLWRCRKWQQAVGKYPDSSGSFSVFLCPANCKPVRQRVSIYLTNFCFWIKFDQIFVIVCKKRDRFDSIKSWGLITNRSSFLELSLQINCHLLSFFACLFSSSLIRIDGNRNPTLNNMASISS
jgi:hypothetical protein